MEVNRRWKQEYDLLKTKYMREKSELDEENHSLKMEISTLKDELTRLANAVNEGGHIGSPATSKCCNDRADQTSQGNGNVDQLIKEQVSKHAIFFALAVKRKKFCYRKHCRFSP